VRGGNATSETVTVVTQRIGQSVLCCAVLYKLCRILCRDAVVLNLPRAQHRTALHGTVVTVLHCTVLYRVALHCTVPLLPHANWLEKSCVCLTQKVHPAVQKPVQSGSVTRICKRACDADPFLMKGCFASVFLALQVSDLVSVALQSTLSQPPCHCILCCTHCVVPETRWPRSHLCVCPSPCRCLIL
jgi:hypothetical protein